MTNPIYLDYNATTPVLPEVVEAMLPFLREHFGNPSSGHWYGAAPAKAIAVAREQVAELLGCSSQQIVFTSGGTEATTLAIVSSCDARRPGGVIVSSPIEHPATSKNIAAQQRLGFRSQLIPVDRSGRIIAEAGAAMVDASTVLVTLMHSNNETGMLQPVAPLFEQARQVGAATHLDATQSFGKVAVDLSSVDFASLAGHKLYAPKGVGALFARAAERVSGVLFGAGQERGARPGTENVAGIVGLGVACEIARKRLASRTERIFRLRQHFWHRLAAIPGLVTNTILEDGASLPNTLSVRFPGVDGNVLLAATPRVAASTGAACHGNSSTASAVILAMGVVEREALGTVRFSLGEFTSREEIDVASDALIATWRNLTRVG